MKTLTIKDETTAGQILNEIALKFESQYITVKELIEERIRVEIKKYEEDVDNYRNVLVTPGPLEVAVNKKRKKKIDIEKQVYVALEAFLNNGFFILIDDEQVEYLEDKFLVDESTQVSFVKLTQLVGG